jgi:hypothetical protein
MEQWVWIIGAAFPVAISLLYAILYGKKFNLNNYLSNKRNSYIQQEYEKLDIDNSIISKLETEIINIQQNLAPNR